MTEPTIQVKGLSKRYVIGEHTASDNLREAMTGLITRPVRALIGKKKTVLPIEQRELWALRDINFDVQPGEVIGIIGRNGAGKSTLLKVLSQITAPTEGEITINGRVGSLLEVGTGFHPELTGRDNIFLNGAILGMTRKEIQGRMADIVEFSEIGKFLDTPVKRYSSGMYTRLAFAVAAHMEPEVLIVDEVLAVGDIAFQNKCLGRMKDISNSGRTVLFVSHNMGAIAQLCNSAVFLDCGKIKQAGPCNEVISTYLDAGGSTQEQQVLIPIDQTKPGQFTKVLCTNSRGEPAAEFSASESIRITLDYQLRQKIRGLYFTLYIRNASGVIVLFSDVRDAVEGLWSDLEPGDHQFTIEFPDNLLAPGKYFLAIDSAGFNGTAVDKNPDCLSWHIVDLASHRQQRPGVLGLKLPWQRQNLQKSSGN